MPVRQMFPLFVLLQPVRQRISRSADPFLALHSVMFACLVTTVTTQLGGFGLQP